MVTQNSKEWYLKRVNQTIRNYDAGAIGRYGFVNELRNLSVIVQHDAAIGEAKIEIENAIAKALQT